MDNHFAIIKNVFESVKQFSDKDEDNTFIFRADFVYGGW